MKNHIFVNTLVATFILSLAPTISAYAEGISVEENNRKFCEQEHTKRGELDQRMFSYCMSKQNEGFADLEALTTKYKTLSWFAGARAALTEKWTKKGITDYNMIHYGLGREVDGYLTVEYKLENNEVSQATFAQCKTKWTKGYEQWSMIDYCIERSE